MPSGHYQALIVGLFDLCTLWSHPCSPRSPIKSTHVLWKGTQMVWFCPSQHCQALFLRAFLGKEGFLTIIFLSFYFYIWPSGSLFFLCWVSLQIFLCWTSLIYIYTLNFCWLYCWTFSVIKNKGSGSGNAARYLHLVQAPWIFPLRSGLWWTVVAQIRTDQVKWGFSCLWRPQPPFSPCVFPWKVKQPWKLQMSPWVCLFQALQWRECQT